jgi:hypothetical protein
VAGSKNRRKAVVASGGEPPANTLLIAPTPAGQNCAASISLPSSTMARRGRSFMA